MHRGERGGLIHLAWSLKALTQMPCFIQYNQPLWTRQWSFAFHKRSAISWPAEGLLVSKTEFGLWHSKRNTPLSWKIR